jgi:hypothetical protein
MSALAPDIEDERRPLPSTISYRPTTNSYNYSSQYTSTTNPSIGQIHQAWLTQQQQYQHYHDQQTTIHSNGTTPQKPQQQQQQQQQRYPISFSKQKMNLFYLIKIFSLTRRIISETNVEWQSTTTTTTITICTANINSFRFS